VNHHGTYNVHPSRPAPGPDCVKANSKPSGPYQSRRMFDATQLSPKNHWTDRRRVVAPGAAGVPGYCRVSAPSARRPQADTAATSVAVGSADPPKFHTRLATPNGAA
jgi:hypothetical protein